MSDRRKFNLIIGKHACVRKKAFYGFYQQSLESKNLSFSDSLNSNLSIHLGVSILATMSSTCRMRSSIH